MDVLVDLDEPLFAQLTSTAAIRGIAPGELVRQALEAAAGLEGSPDRKRIDLGRPIVTLDLRS